MDYDYLKQKRILLVDDEQELLDMVVSILNEDGFQNIKTAKTVKCVFVSSNHSPYGYLPLCLLLYHRNMPFYYVR